MGLGVFGLGYLLALRIEGFAGHFYPAAVYTPGFVGVDCMFCFLLFGQGEVFFGLCCVSARENDVL